MGCLGCVGSFGELEEGGMGEGKAPLHGIIPFN